MTPAQHLEMKNVARFFKQIRRHFTGTAYKAGCRCEHCIDANRRKEKRWRDNNPDIWDAIRRRSIQKVMLRPETWVHGKRHTYSAKRCRCYKCVECAAREGREYRARVAAQKEQG